MKSAGGGGVWENTPVRNCDCTRWGVPALQHPPLHDACEHARRLGQRQLEESRGLPQGKKQVARCRLCVTSTPLSQSAKQDAPRCHWSCRRQQEAVAGPASAEPRVSRAGPVREDSAAQRAGAPRRGARPPVDSNATYAYFRDTPESGLAHADVCSQNPRQFQRYARLNREVARCRRNVEGLPQLCQNLQGCRMRDGEKLVE